MIDSSRILICVMISTLVFVNPFPVMSEVTVGVNDGDSFDFVVTEYREGVGINEVYFMGYDPVDFYEIDAEEGDEFTITFVNATPYTPYLGIYWIDLEVSYQGLVFEETQHLNRTIHLRRWIISSNMEIMIPAFMASVEYLNSEIQNNEYQNGSYTLINSETEVGITGGHVFYDNSDEEYSTFNAEFRMEKSTGVMLYEHEKQTFEYLDEEGSFKDESNVILRKGYIHPDSKSDKNGSDDGFIPGFELVYSFVVISFVLIITYKKSRSNL